MPRCVPLLLPRMLDKVRVRLPQPNSSALSALAQGLMEVRWSLPSGQCIQLAPVSALQEEKGLLFEQFGLSSLHTSNTSFPCRPVSFNLLFPPDPPPPHSACCTCTCTPRTTLHSRHQAASITLHSTSSWDPIELYQAAKQERRAPQSRFRV